ncbi:hypothetical protein D3C75_1051210 [compost metagenome]
MGGKQQPCSRILQLLQNADQILLGSHIQSGEGFIHQKQSGLLQHGLHDAHLLKHSFGKIADRRILGMFQPTQCQKLPCPLPEPPLVHPAYRSHMGQVLNRAEAQERHPFRHQAGPAA